MEGIITSIGQVFTQGIGWVKTLCIMLFGGTLGTGEAAVTYQASPLLLLFLILPLVGLGVGLFKRVIHVE